MRKIIVDGETYYWKVGKSFIEIRDAEKRKVHLEYIHEFLGISVYEWNRYEYPVTPKRVADHIRSRWLNLKHTILVA